MALPYPVVAAATGNLDLQSQQNQAINRLTDGTGWRTLTPLLENGWTATSVRIIRRGNRVTVRVNNLNGTSATANKFLTPATTPELLAFLPESGHAEVRRVFQSAGSQSSITVRITSTDGLSSDARVTTADWQELTWETNRDWPTTLPGTAV